MSNQTITVDQDFVTDDRINGNNKMVFMYLKLRSNYKNPVAITLEELAEDLYVTTNTIKTSVKSLEAHNYIKIKKEVNANGKLSNTYEVIR